MAVENERSYYQYINEECTEINTEVQMVKKDDAVLPLDLPSPLTLMQIVTHSNMLSCMAMYM